MEIKKFIQIPREVEAFKITERMLSGDDKPPFDKVKISEGFAGILKNNIILRTKVKAGDFITKDVFGDITCYTAEMFNKSYAEITNFKIK